MIIRGSAIPRERYYLAVKTAPHAGWLYPVGWSYDSLKNARRGARIAADQWMHVRLIDGTTGKCVRYAW